MNDKIDIMGNEAINAPINELFFATSEIITILRALTMVFIKM